MNKQSAKRVFLTGVKAAKEKLDAGVERVGYKLGDGLDWCSHTWELAETEQELKETNPQMYDVLPDIMRAISRSEVTPLQLYNFLESLEFAKDEPPHTDDLLP